MVLVNLISLLLKLIPITFWPKKSLALYYLEKNDKEKADYYRQIYKEKGGN